MVRASRRDGGALDAAPVVQAGLEPYTTPLTLDDVLHLYRRLGYAVSMPVATSHVGKQASVLVEELLGPEDPGDPSPDMKFAQWLDPATQMPVDYTENPNGADIQTRLAIEGWWKANHRSLSNWWLASMVKDQKAIESLTMFWMSHWATQFSFDETYMVPQMHYRQYKMLRRRRLGSFQQMTLDVTVDNAMVFYLGGTYNEVGKPNENYGRELLELFTTGIGWYTEGDVQQAARVLTGWKTSRFNDAPAPKGIYNTWFDANRHDTGAKEFLGVTIPARTVDNNTEYQVLNEEVLELIKIILRVRPDAVARFISRKAYLHFIYSSKNDVDNAFINDLAAEFRSSDFTIKPLLKKLLTSQYFFDPAIRGAQIKAPIDFVVGLQRQFGVEDLDPQFWIESMDQSLMNPPNVAGWPGYHAWMSTNSYPRRREFARKLIDAMTDTRANAFIREFNKYDDVAAFVLGVTKFLLPVAVSQARLDFYKNALLENQPDYTWGEKLQVPAAAARAMRELLKAIAKAPDFQLC
ncbi:MAG: DUF1800 family protein [Candidatus Kapabacteria bacterium]|nr:DUF1800 family protein [Candidatus Kapabacteria bacterium]